MEEAPGTLGSEHFLLRTRDLADARGKDLQIGGGLGEENTATLAQKLELAASESLEAPSAGMIGRPAIVDIDIAGEVPIEGERRSRVHNALEWSRMGLFGAKWLLVWKMGSCGGLVVEFGRLWGCQHCSSTLWPELPRYGPSCPISGHPRPSWGHLGHSARA
jgi:hypothetical protein